jgi:signal transduction histidine kinase
MELRDAESDLARARWLAGIGETALAMEREISEPLETILERSRLLLEDDSFNADQREQLGIIREQGIRLSGVVGRAVNLQSPQSVEYLGGARMIDLSSESGTSDRAPRHQQTRASDESDGSGKK